VDGHNAFAHPLKFDELLIKVIFFYNILYIQFGWHSSRDVVEMRLKSEYAKLRMLCVTLLVELSSDWVFFLIALIARLILKSLFVFHLQVDVVGPLLLNASLLLVLTTDYSDWLVQATELIDIWCDGVFWVLTIMWLNNIELSD